MKCPICDEEHEAKKSPSELECYCPICLDIGYYYSHNATLLDLDGKSEMANIVETQ